MGGKRKTKARVIIRDGTMYVFGRKKPKPKILRQGEGKKYLKAFEKIVVSGGRGLKEILPTKSKGQLAKFNLPQLKSIYRKPLFGFLKKRKEPKMVEEDF